MRVGWLQRHMIKCKMAVGVMVESYIFVWYFFSSQLSGSAVAFKLLLVDWLCAVSVESGSLTGIWFFVKASAAKDSEFVGIRYTMCPEVSVAKRSSPSSPLWRTPRRCQPVTVQPPFSLMWLIMLGRFLQRTVLHGSMS